MRPVGGMAETLGRYSAAPNGLRQKLRRTSDEGVLVDVSGAPCYCCFVWRGCRRWRCAGPRGRPEPTVRLRGCGVRTMVRRVGNICGGSGCVSVSWLQDRAPSSGLGGQSCTTLNIIFTGSRTSWHDGGLPRRSLWKGGGGGRSSGGNSGEEA